MSAISLKSITGITSITTPSGVDNVFTVHTNDTTERFRVDQTGNLNIAGIVTVTKDLDVDGHTNLDNVNVSGTSTITGVLYPNNGIRVPNQVYSYFGSGNDLSIRHDETGGHHSYIFHHHNTGVFKLASDTQMILGETGPRRYIEMNKDNDVKLYFNNNHKFQTTNTGINVIGSVVATGADINGDLDVDGHTNLDNVNISGVTTSGNLTINGDLTVNDNYPSIHLSDYDSNSDFMLQNQNGIFTVYDVTNNADRFEILSDGTVRSPHYTLQSQSPSINFIDTNHDSDFMIQNANGLLKIYDNTNGADRFGVNSSGSVFVYGDELHIGDSIIHRGDTDTKIRFPAADQISFETSGTEYLKLHRYSSVNFVEVGASATLSLANNGSGNRYIVIGDGNASSTGALKLQAGGGSTGWGGGITMYSHANTTNAGGVYIGKSLNSSGAIIFGNGGTSPSNEYLRIASSGDITATSSNVTQSVTSGAAILKVQTTATSGDALIQASGEDGSGNTRMIQMRTDAGNSQYRIISSDTSYNLALCTGNGPRVLISGSSAATSIGGANSFDALLTTQGDISGGLLKLKASENTTRLFVSGTNSNGVEVNLYDEAGGQKGILGVSGSEFFIKAPNNSAPLTFYTHNGTSLAERMVLKSDGKVGMQVATPKSNLHVYGPGDIRIGSQYGGHASIAQQVSYSSGYTGVHWMFETNGQMSWCFDGVMIVHGTGGSSYGTEVTHIKLIYSRESGVLNSGDTWRNGSSDYNIETLGHGQVGLNPSAGNFSYAEQTDPDGAASSRSLFKLSWSASGQSVGVWSKLIGNLYWAAAGSGSVELQDKDSNIVFNSI